MGSDGAQLGINAEAAMGKIVGGKDIPDDAIVSMQEQADRIMAVDITAQPRDYGHCADIVAKCIVLWLREDPSRASGPPETVYERDPEGNLVFNDEGGLNVVMDGWYDRMKQGGSDYGKHIEALGISGFQWGWAVNAARAIVELPAVPNPAIIEVGG